MNPKHENNMETVLTRIRSEFGLRTMANGKTLISIFCDLSQVKQDQRLLRYLVEVDGHKALLELEKLSPAMQQTRFQQTVNKLCTEMLVSEEAARQVCTAFCNAVSDSTTMFTIPQTQEKKSVPKKEREEIRRSEISDQRKNTKTPELVLDTPSKSAIISRRTKSSGSKTGIGLLIAALLVALVFLPMMLKGGMFTPDSSPQAQTAKQQEINSTEKSGEKSEVKAKSGVIREDPMQYTRDGDGHLKTFPVFGTELMRDQVASITFLSTLEDAPENVYDLSSAGDGSVLGWAILNGELYDLYIAADGGVKAPSNCQTMFAHYKNVWCISFNDSFDTSDTTNMSGMFEGCNIISLIDLQCFKTSKVTDMSAMFDGCGLLTQLDVTSFDTSHVTNMDNMFYGCTFLRELDLSSLDTSSVTSMNKMFGACGLLEKLDLSSFNTASVTSMNGMFTFCDSLVAIDVSSFNTENVQDMGGMFQSCSKLKEINLQNFHTPSLTNMSYMFDKCEELMKLDLSNFETASVTKMSYVFTDCNKLKTLMIPNLDVSNVTTYRHFMNDGAKINGRPWETFFVN